MKLLRVIASIDPATGGPVAGLQAITPVLAAHGITTEFLTVDAPDADHLAHWHYPAHALGPASGRYARSPRVAPWLAGNLRRYDAVVIHGLWQHLGAATRRAAIRYNIPHYIYPHGMLDPALREIYPLKHLKKLLYWLFVERHNLRTARAVLYTCAEEQRLAQRAFPFYRAHDHVVPYGTTTPMGSPATWRAAWHARYPALAERPFLLFLGRIHSKKGIDLLLRAYAQLLKTTTPSPLYPIPDLALAGPCFDPDFLEKLKQFARSSGIAPRLHWLGMLDGAAKWGALASAEAMILPSHQENFGIAVVEALAVGTPVLISDRVNIHPELTTDAAALVEPDTEAGSLRLLTRWQALGPEARAILRQNAAASFNKRFELTHSVSSLASLLKFPVGK